MNSVPSPEHLPHLSVVTNRWKKKRNITTIQFVTYRYNISRGRVLIWVTWLSVQGVTAWRAPQGIFYKAQSASCALKNFSVAYLCLNWHPKVFGFFWGVFFFKCNKIILSPRLFNDV